MKPIRDTCVPRPDVLKGDMGDAIYAADFGYVVEGTAPAVYGDATLFFRNTHPAIALRKLVATVFGRLADPSEAGAAVRLSTGFGGGKSHSLIALWHLARNVGQATLGTEILPAAGRPDTVAVAGVDGEKLGATVCGRHGGITTRSLWGELAYQLGGESGYKDIADQDNPEEAPDAATVRGLLPASVPVLILLDEVVKYSIKLTKRGQGALLAFLGSLISEVGARPQAVLVISDPASQAAYQEESSALAAALAENAVAKRLDDELGRKTSDYDPIGTETAQVILRRLFDKVDADAAQEASAEYYSLYKRVTAEFTDALPPDAPTAEYCQRVAACYPFHPRLLDTARDRLGALQDFNKSRGTLRLFARILRDIWESGSDLSLITAGDLDWTSPRIQADLLQRLNRDRFQAAVDADVVAHAGRLDADYSTDSNRRVASALLLESIAMTPSSVMSKRDLTLATLRPTDVGNEAGDAIDNLMRVCWHTYKDETGTKYQFRYEANVNKLIEERAEGKSLEDARMAVLSLAQGYFGGYTFKLVSYPATPRAVADTADLKLVLTESEKIAQSVCDYEDDSDPEAKRPRRFRNAIFAVAPTASALTDAAVAMRYLQAAEEIEKEQKTNKNTKAQLDGILPSLRRRARLRAVRAFDRVLFQGRPSVSLEEKYLVSEDGALQDVQGQAQLKKFLEDNKLIFAKTDVIDVDLLVDFVMKGATPSLDHDGAHPASAVHERALSSDRLRLLQDVDPVRASILRGVERNRVVVRLPSGDVYDTSGCITTALDGRRERAEGKRLTTLKLDTDVLIAPATAPCVGGWRKIDPLPAHDSDKAATDGTGIDGGMSGGSSGYQPSFPSWQVAENATAMGWDTAIQYAASRPLRNLQLKASKIEAARTLAALALPFGAGETNLSFSLGGTVKDGGGMINFAVDSIKHNHAIKPLEQAAMFLRALDSAGVSFEAVLCLAFGDTAPADAATKLVNARDGAADGVTIEAEFGKEAK